MGYMEPPRLYQHEAVPGLCPPAGSCKFMQSHTCVCMQAVLEAAHEMEIGMGYMEPPRLYQPVKHCLGYMLQQAGNHQRAAEVGGCLLQNPCLLWLSVHG